VTPAEAIDLALPLLDEAANALEAKGPFHCDLKLIEGLRAAWNTLQALRTEQAEAALVAKDPANQRQP
jgi:hypothetical protein